MAWSMRTGKSKACIDRACHLHLNKPEDGKGPVDGVLIFAPNGVHANWVEREFPLHMWQDVPWLGIAWRSSVGGSKHGNKLSKADREEWNAAREFFWNDLRLAKTSKRLIVFAVNSESMIRKDVRAAVARFLKLRKRVMLIVDESDDFGTPGSTRTKMLRALALRPNVTPRVILSGTMLTATPLAAFSQFEILQKGALGFDTYDAFKDHFAEYDTVYSSGRSYPKLKRFINLDELRERVAKWTSVVLRDECDDMPALEEWPVHITPTPQQRRAYEELRESFIVDLEAGLISVGERANRFQKMQQVFSGFINDEYRDRHYIPGDNPRLDALSREVWLAPGKTIIWCEYHADIDLVKQRLLGDIVPFVEYHGRVGDKVKAASLQAFNEDEAVEAFVGHVQAGGRGLDISVASTIINYSHTFKARLRAQSLERATKIGGRNIRVVDIIAPGPDEYILKTTNERINVNDAVAGRGLRSLLMGMAI